jgi:hypothetical protein
MAASALSVLVIIITGLWIWMARANKRGRSWARITATVFFGFLTAGDLAWLITFLTSKITLAGLYIGLDVAFPLVYWLVALSAVVLLWRRSSSDYYTAVGNQSRAIRAASRKRQDQSAVPRITDPDPS